MLIEKVTLADLNEISCLSPEGWGDISPEFENYINHDYCEPIKVCMDGIIVGLGCNIIFESSAWLAHIIVHEGYRNKRLGSTIVDYLISDLKSRNINSILLIATEMGKPVYERTGFIHVSDYTFLERKEKWKIIGYSDNIKPISDDYYDQLLKLDSFISGEKRDVLIHHYLDDGYIYIANGVLKGFYLPSLGDGMIFALENHVGIELMKLKYSIVNKATLPAENSIGLNFLLENGFVLSEKKGYRMVLGENVEWKPQCFFSRIGGNYG